MMLLLTSFTDLFHSSLQTLRHISLKHYVEQDSFNLLVSILESIAGKNIVDNMTILAVVIGGPDNAYGDGWGVLDKVFTQSQSGWKMLKNLSLHIRVHYGEFEDVIEGGQACDALVDALWELPETQLQGLVGSKDFQFNFDVAEYEGHLYQPFTPVKLCARQRRWWDDELEVFDEYPVYNCDI